jgi:deoxyribonuclease-4
LDRLLFGVSGLPLGPGAGKKKFTYATGVEHLADLGLDAMELPFVRSVNVSAKNAPGILEARRRRGFHLTAHGSYYVNLAAEDAAIREKSRQRLAACAQAAQLVEARVVVFHPGYYQGQDAPAALERISAELALLAAVARETGVAFHLETTGKPSQFGTVEEIIELCRRHPHCRPCIDFAHIHARGNGRLKRHADFVAILERIALGLGPQALEDLHMHVAGISYTAKGERCHLPLLESDFQYMEFLRALRDFRVRGCLVAEGPLVEADALRLRDAYRAL